MNIRRWIYFQLVRFRGYRMGSYFRHYLREDTQGIPPDVVRKNLVEMLEYCKRSVPYYSEIMQGLPDTFIEHPEESLQDFPILTKEILRNRFEDLKSSDLEQRKWFFNTSGGSTGEPVRFIQDADYAARSGAIKQLYSKLIGREIGEKEIHLWGSARDLTGNNEAIEARFINWLTRTQFQSIFRMTPERMQELIHILNQEKPKLIVAYTNSLFDLAKFADSEGLKVVPQNAIIASAYTLYPFMRLLIEKVFQCPVYNRYGSREVGDVACERPGFQGLWVAPWGAYVEIVDRDGNRVPDGTLGEILVTSFKNFAMPLIRYKIGDMGRLAPPSEENRIWKGQFLQEVLGRSNENFINQNGTLVTAGHFMPMLYFRDWIVQYQIVQKKKDLIVFNFVTSAKGPDQEEMLEIENLAKHIVGADCQVKFNFVDEILPSPSGKFRYIYSEVNET